MTALQGKRFLVLVGDDYEDLELWYPKLRLTEAGAGVTVAGPGAGQKYLGKHGYPCVSDAAISGLSADEFAGIVIPGGWMPDRLRRDRVVLDLVRSFAGAKKLVASICHGPSINVSAGICAGLRMTSSLAIKDDLVNAGANWVDEAAVVDGFSITSRTPSDLPAFCRAMLHWFT